MDGLDRTRPGSRSASSLVSAAVYDKMTFSSRTQSELQRIGGARLVLSSIHDRAALSTGARIMLGSFPRAHCRLPGF
jgi:hypothetical protein